MQRVYLSSCMHSKFFKWYRYFISSGMFHFKVHFASAVAHSGFKSLLHGSGFLTLFSSLSLNLGIWLHLVMKYFPPPCVCSPTLGSEIVGTLWATREWETCQNSVLALPLQNLGQSSLLTAKQNYLAAAWSFRPQTAFSLIINLDMENNGGHKGQPSAAKSFLRSEVTWFFGSEFCLCDEKWSSI